MANKKKPLPPPPFEVSKTVYLQQRWQMCQKIGKAIYSSDLTWEFVQRLQLEMENEKHFIKIIKAISDLI